MHTQMYALCLRTTRSDLSYLLRLAGLHALKGTKRNVQENVSRQPIMHAGGGTGCVSLIFFCWTCSSVRVPVDCRCRRDPFVGSKVPCVSESGVHGICTSVSMAVPLTGKARHGGRRYA